MKKIFSIMIVGSVAVLLCVLLVQVVATDTAYAAGLANPINANSIQDLISQALKFAVNLLAIAGVLYIIWSGFLMVKAQGNPEELKKAKAAFMNAVIGMAIILGAWAIATVIANTINKITKQNVTLPSQK